MEKIYTSYHQSTEQENQKPEPINENEKKKTEESEPTENRKHRRVRIKEKEEHTLKLLLELEAVQAGREYLAEDFTVITGRNYTTEARHLKTLWEQGKLNRQWKNRQYCYTLVNTDSKTVSQNPVSDSQSPATQEKDSRTTHL